MLKDQYKDTNLGLTMWGSSMTVSCTEIIPKPITKTIYHLVPWRSQDGITRFHLIYGVGRNHYFVVSHRSSLLCLVS